MRRMRKILRLTILGGGVVTICFGIIAWRFAYDHVRQAFDFQANLFKEAVSKEIQASDAVIKSMQAFFQASIAVEADEFRVYSEGIIASYPFISSISYYPRILDQDRQSFEAEQERFGTIGFRIFEYAGSRKIPVRKRPLYFPALYREPFNADAAMWLGYDLLSDNEMKSIILTAISTGQAIPSTFREQAGQYEYDLIAAVYEGKRLPTTSDEREERVNGLLSLTVHTSQLVKKLLSEYGFTFRFRHLPESEDQPAQFVVLHGSGTTTGLTSKTPLTFSTIFPLHISSQHFEIRLSQVIPLREFELWLVILAMLIGGLGSWAVFSILQGHESLKQELETRHLVEQSLQRLNEELEFRVRNRTAKLEAMNEELRDFAHVVSHDLKAPLRGITNLVRWIIDDYADHLDAEGKEMLSLLVDRVKRLNGMIVGILHYSRVTRLQGENLPIDVNNVLQEILLLLAPPAHIHIALEPPFPTIIANPIQIQQIFQNLLSNAMKCMDKADGKITVSCADEKDFWIFRVSDNGPGIAPEHQMRIFQLFQTGVSGKQHDHTGIGLTIVKKLVEAYGGTIWVESTVGEGSTFSFTFPKENLC